MIKVLHALGALGAIFAMQAAPATSEQARGTLAEYRAELGRFRAEFGGTRNMPDVPFFLFGMGARTKLLFKDGRLLNATNMAVVREWPNGEAITLPHEYSVIVKLADGSETQILEDETSVWFVEKNARTPVAGTKTHVHLPRFEESSYSRVLRVLHQEILINIAGGKPVPNFFVYRKPWLRDSAMMALCLARTDNLGLIRNWLAGLREPYDRNNNGETEADNLGQALYLASLAGGKDHPGWRLF